MERDWLDSRTLREIAKEHGISARSLELWRARGLLPAPTRQPKGRAVWLYPPDTARQLEQLLYWRGKTRTLGLIAIALWIEGFPIEVEPVRDALEKVVDQLESELDSRGDQHAFIEDQARKLAGARGKHAFPRVVRMTSEERVRACAYLLAVALDAGDEIERRKDDVVLVERMLGLRSGHRGGLAHQEPFNDAVKSLKPILAPEKAREALAAATDEQLELTRLTARMTSVWVPLLLPEMLAALPTSEAGPLRKFSDHHLKDAALEAWVVQIIHQLLAMHDRQPEPDEITQAITALRSVTTDLMMLSLFPVDKRRSVLGQLPAEKQHSIVSEIRRRRAPRTKSEGT